MVDWWIVKRLYYKDQGSRKKRGCVMYLQENEHRAYETHGSSTKLAFGTGGKSTPLETTFGPTNHTLKNVTKKIRLFVSQLNENRTAD
jgi:hypothetical protein